ncbi:hypothetical protein [Methylomusa anaerophila]|uniref:hypothetical protein n=1 Tax=Methylomusa anaerophila TaxID=1930071 RepID=UPI0013158904|nr:hypothetical protein [Methylomusa anaerophila]
MLYSYQCQKQQKQPDAGYEAKERLSVSEQLLSKILGKLESIDTRLSNVENRIGSLEDRMGNVENRIGSLEDRMGNVENRIGSLEDRMGSLEGRMGSLEDRMGSLEGRMGSLEDRIGSLEGRMGNVEEQSGETNQIVKALMHRTEELDAKFDGLLHTVVTKECIAPLATREDIARIAETQELHTQWLRKLSADTTQHELEINRLKVAK